MKKVIILGLFLTSCKSYNTIHYSKNINKCVSNLETMQQWLLEDFEDGKISLDVANNYMLVLQNTKCGLLKKIKGDESGCVE